MKSSTNLTTGVTGTNVRDALRYNYDAEALPSLKADWNLNRYTSPVASNVIDEAEYGYNVSVFPISSIVDVLRPGRKGIVKGIIGQSVVGTPYNNSAEPKFYTGSDDDIYKYWVSPRPTDGTGTFPSITTVTATGKTPVTDPNTHVQPTVVYGKNITVNEIVVRVENTWATPSDWTIQVATNVGATNWAGISTNPTVNNDGTAVVYYNATGGWSNTAGTLGSTVITGIRLVVRAMGPGKRLNGNTTRYRTKYSGGGTGYGVAPFQTYVNTTGANSNFSLIAIEPHYVVDFSDRLITASDTFDIGEASQLHPIGTITSNTATITLDNTDFLLDKENAASPYYGLLDANVDFNLQYVYTISGTQYAVQQFKMYSSEWAPGDGEITVSLEDSSKFLKEIKPQSTLYQNKTVNEIVWRILDSVGFHDYEIGQEDFDPDQFVIPIFWTTGEDTVWEVLDQLSQSTQTAIYFNSLNKLQVRTRDAAFRRTATPDWNMYGQKSGINLPDIVSLEQTDEMESNKITVSYKETEWRKNVIGGPALSRVWDADTESVVVRSSALTNTLAPGDTTISLSSQDASVWPYASTVNIDAEILSYDAKQYTYYVVSNPADPSTKVANTVWVTSEDEKKANDKLTDPDYRWMNSFTGLLRVKSRAMWNSTAATHSTDTSNYAATYEVWPLQQKVGGHTAPPGSSRIDVNTNGTSMYQLDTVGSRSTYNRFGTMVKLNGDGSWHQIAGIHCFGTTATHSGYFFEIMASSKISPENFANGWREACLYRRDNGGYTVVASAAIPILEDYWYELDMDVTRGIDTSLGNWPAHGVNGKIDNKGGNHGAGAPFDFIRCFVNGQLVFQTGVYNPIAPTNTFGIQTRWKTNASFEYNYAVDRTLSNFDLVDFSFYDLKEGGYRGALFEREFVYDILNNPNKRDHDNTVVSQQDKFGGIAFSDFGPFMHEIRTFDVKFDPAPVMSSYLFSTNSFAARILQYRSSPYGAHFVIANTARRHAILAGEDTVVYGGVEGSVNEVCTILGRDLEIQEAQTVEAKNDQMIRIRGVVETEITSDWIQSKVMAQALADWISTHWAQGVDQISVEVFGNPVLEIGDVVDIAFDEKHMTPATHKYYVLGTSTQFDQGLSTSLTLRRVR